MKQKASLAIFLVGSDRLARPLKALFPPRIQRRTTIIGKDLGRLSTSALCRRLEGTIADLTAMNLKERGNASIEKETSMKRNKSIPVVAASQDLAGT